jgi:ribosomal-protein-alanine N-acetyltransferase
MNIAVKIEKATTKDFNEIYEVELLSYEEPWPKEMFVMDYLFNAQSEYYVARWMGKIVGFIAVWNELEKLHIVNIAVNPKYRKKGIGTKLLGFAIKIAKKNSKKEIYLEVRKSNEIAQKLYEKFGFARVREIERYYNNGENGYIMRKAINEYTRN